MTTPWWQIEWLWTAAGWTLLTCGGVALAWAMFWDRARGRRRCAGCWYDMAGIPARAEGGVEKFTCPECGRAGIGERSLRRTRRRKRWGAAALFLMLLGYGAVEFLAVKNHGWVGAVPSTALVMFGQTDSWRDVGAAQNQASFRRIRGAAPLAGPPAVALPWRVAMGEEAWRRVAEGRMWEWQSQWFVGRALDVGKVDLRSGVRMPKRWMAGEPIPVMLDESVLMGPQVIPQGYALVLVPDRDAMTPWTYSKMWEIAPMSAGATRRVRMRVALVAGKVEVYSRGVERTIKAVADAGELFHVDGSAATSELVRRVFDVRLCLPSRGGATVVIANRSANQAWSRLRIGLGCRVVVKVDQEVAARGAHWPEWSRSVFKNWDEIDLHWEPGMLERARSAPERVRVEVRGDARESWRAYSVWPFDDLDPTCWTGMFEVTPRVVARPEAGAPDAPARRGAGSMRGE